MKHFTIALFLSAMVFTPVFAQNKVADETAVRKVVDDVGTAFIKKDLNAFGSFFVKSPELYCQVYTEDGMVILAHGWEAMTRMMGNSMKDNSPSSDAKMMASDYKIHIKGAAAWLSSHTDWVLPGGKKGFSRDFIVLEKQQGTWKIAALTSQNYAEGKFVEVK